MDDTNLTLGLKQNSQFTIAGVFDLVLPDSPREAYGAPCTARGAIYTAAIVGGMMLVQFTRSLRRMPVDHDLMLSVMPLWYPS